jgi:hypothetical protein
MKALSLDAHFCLREHYIVISSRSTFAARQSLKSVDSLVLIISRYLFYCYNKNVSRETWNKLFQNLVQCFLSKN